MADAQDKQLQIIPNRGMWLDSLESQMPEGFYGEAWNMVRQTDEESGFGLSNEQANELFLLLPEGFDLRGRHLLADRDQVVVCLYDEDTDFSEVGLVDLAKKTYTTKINDNTLGGKLQFSKNRWIHIASKPMDLCNDRWVYFSANYTYRFFNIDSRLLNELTLEDTALFRCYCVPAPKTYKREIPGGDLPNGIYQYVAKLQDDDLNETNWFNINNPISLADRRAVPGEPSGEAVDVRVQFTGDHLFDRIVLAVIKTINGKVHDPEILVETSYTPGGFSFLHHSVEQGTGKTIPLAAVIAKQDQWIRGDNLMTHDGRLHLYNLVSPYNINMQAQADAIEVSWGKFAAPAEDSANIKGLMGGELIDIAIRPNYCDGTKGPAFHINGRAKEPEDTAPVYGDSCSECPLEKWQVEDTSYVTATYCEMLPNELGKVTQRGSSGGGGGNSGGGAATADGGGSGRVDLNVFPEYKYTRPEAILTVYEDPPCNFCGRSVPLNWAVNNWGIAPASDMPSTDAVEIPIEITTETTTQKYDKDDNEDGQETSTSTTSYTFSAPGGPGQANGTCYKCRNWIQDPTVAASGCIGPGCPCEEPSNQTKKHCNAISAGTRVRRVKYSAAQGSSSCSGGGSCSGGSCGGGSSCSGGLAGGSNCAGGNCGGAVNTGEGVTAEATGGGSNAGGGGLNPDSSVGSGNPGGDTGCTASGGCTGSVGSGNSSAGGCSNDAGSADCTGPRYKGAEIDDVLEHCGEAIGYLSRLKERFSATKGSGQEVRNQLYVSRSPGGRDSLGTYSTRVLGGCESKDIYDETGCFVVGKEYPVVQEGKMGYWESTLLYPDTKDCDGNLIYGENAGKPIRRHRVPSRRFHPHVNANQSGVVTRFAPGNIETGETDYFHFGLILRNIQLPPNPPKPYCKENPFTIMIRPITEKNRSVIAKGIAPGTFKGTVNDEEYSIPRNGINSIEFYDRHILPSDDNLKEIRGGELNDVPGYMFYSPETQFDRPFLNADRVNVEMALMGKGHRYGQYAEGEEPESSWGARINQRGTRQAVNLNIPLGPRKAGAWPGYIVSDVQDHRCLRGAIYAAGDRVTDHGDRLRRSVMNLKREKGVYFELEDLGDTILNQQRFSLGGLFDSFLSDNSYNGLPGGNLAANQTGDASFLGDGVDFEAPIHYAEAPYVALTRRIPDQYGGVESAEYETLYEGTAQDLEEGRCWFLNGDTFIHNFTFRRTAYISENVGKTVSPQSDAQAWFGFVGDCGEMPDEEGLVGCDSDPRVCNNIRGGNVNPAFRRAWDGNSSFPGFTPPHLNQVDDRLYSVYFPGVLNTLVNFPVETRINLAHRQVGNEMEHGEIVSEKLTDIYRDSNAPLRNRPWKDAWLNRFYIEMPEITTLKKIMRFLFNIVLILMIPAMLIALVLAVIMDILLAIGKAFKWIIDQFASSSSKDSGGILGGLDDIDVGDITSQAASLLAKLTKTETRIGIVDRLLGINQCLGDHERGGNDRWVRQWEDNYYKYDFTHSRGNDIEPAYGIPANYYVCDCADDTYNNKDVYSNKQVVNSPVDSWRNFKINNYVEVPPELGQVTRIFGMGNSLYIHTTDGLINVRSSGGQLEVGDDSVYIGRGDLFNVSAPIYGGVVEGVAGLKDGNALEQTKYGVIFPDREARTFYLFDGRTPTPASNQGVKHFLRNNGHLELLEHFPDFKVVDQKSKHGIGYSIGVDNGRERILFTKRDYVPKEGVNLTLSADKESFEGVTLGDPAYFDDKSFTLTYSPADGTWESFHNYMPLVYLWDRHKLWSFEENRLLIHNVPGKFQVFDGEFYPASVDLHTHDRTTMDVVDFVSLEMDTEASRWNGCQYVRGFEETFTEAIFWNHFATTGQLPLRWSQVEDAKDTTKYRNDSIPMEYNYRRWNISSINNVVKDENEPVFECRTAVGPVQVNTSNIEVPIDNALQHTKNMKFTDNHLSMRFVFSKFTDVKLMLKYILVRAKSRNR